MEGINQLGQEEYIWAMRTSAYRESDQEVWRDRVNVPAGDSSRSKEKSLLYTGGTGEQQTKVMASLVPDEVIYNVNDYAHRPYDACFLFGDVSGFTELCEKYSLTGVAGPSRLTQVLNKYLGAMVQEIMSHNGDVLKFSGDAFLAMWKCSENETMRDAVHETIDCALVIQKTYGVYETDVGVLIRVKLAISAGHVLFALIGDQNNSHYVVVGKPIWDVKAAEKHSSAGDIVVSPAAWHYTNSNEYVAEEMPDGIHMKIVGIGPNWRSVQKNVRNQKIGRSPSDDILSNYDEDSMSSEQSSLLPIMEQMNDEFLLRPAVNAATRLNIKKDLRKFIIAPVMKSIDMDEPFEYLTEMRQSVVLIVNVVSRNIDSKQGLIELADTTYKIVSSKVNESKGCVNKVSLFDKDLMMVIIFGLRGLKHELESQIALKCASECHTAISALPAVLSCSIGVTTGKTYCGVFGHTLRREYTVISLTVNKAARLMCAYKGKVTCDRETFLHSKMEAKNFILQEHIDLKGISNPGPVYEFKEIMKKHHDVAYKISPFPLLGREEELKLFTKVVKQFVDAFKNKTGSPPHKMLIIQGNPRQGKTRLLQELIYCTPPDIPVSRFTISIRDSKVPYQSIKLVFNTPLGLRFDSTPREKEDKLAHVLRNLKVPDLLCVFNPVFGVDFKKTDLFNSLSKSQRKIVLAKMIKQLCYACFKTNWIIAIDDGEYIDDESWELVEVLLHQKTMFIVITIGKGKPLSAYSKKYFSDERVMIRVLKSIERLYHGALACQILDVYAIPPDLEKVIQEKSSGNPGWIESFLISLIQAEGLYIMKTDFKQMNDLGLVSPPLYMMCRMNPDEVSEWKHIMEEKRSSMMNITDDYKMEDAWKVYIDTCRDSYLNVVMRDQMESKMKRNKNIMPVCLISPNFNVGDVDSELSMDVIILKTFDSLTSYEQLLIKCSAILGNQFSRDMLLFVMSSAVPRETALAVQKLFEIKVLSCAKGDFLEGGNMVFRERLMNPNDVVELKCECRGIRIEDTCSDLPKYASCGYMQFRSSMFRDITYNLLTDNQKKEFHHRAIRYLEKETRRCRACGNGFFDRILGMKQDDDLQSRKSKKQQNKRRSSASTSFDEASSVSRKNSVYSTGTGSLAKRKDPNKISESQSLAEASAILGEPKPKQYNACLGITLINKLKNSFSLTRAFSSEDFTDCQCVLILNTTYAQLTEHCRGAANYSKLVDSMIEYSFICIISHNIPLAMRILFESLEIIEEQNKTPAEDSWKLNLIRARIYSLLGYSRMELGQLDDAQIYFFKALNEYGFTFPKEKCVKKFNTFRHKFKHIFGFYVFPRTLTKKSLDVWENMFCNNLSKCLGHLSNLFLMKRMWIDAELAAVWSLSRALLSFTDFEVLCRAFANMIWVWHCLGKKHFCIGLEVHALRICHLKTHSVESEELKAVAKLYGVIFRARLLRSNMEKAIHIGYIVLRISSSIHAVTIILPILPLLMHALLFGKHISNAISMIQELDYFADEDTDSSGRMWYYALCTCFQLETGYTIVPYQKSENFYQVEGDNMITLRDEDSRKRFFVTMWLWCVRNEKWELASLWSVKMRDFSMVKETDTISYKITALYHLEGLILYLVSKMDRRNIKARMKAEEEIHQFFSQMEKATKNTTFVLPRFYHLKAYYRFVKYNDSMALTLLNKAKKLSEKYGNPLELAWIEHSERAWTRNMPLTTVEFWKEHSDIDNLLDFQELEVNAGKVCFYTLPTPLYM